jgi:hypothetical protein
MASYSSMEWGSHKGTKLTELFVPSLCLRASVRALLADILAGCHLRMHHLAAVDVDRLTRDIDCES